MVLSCAPPYPIFLAHPRAARRPSCALVDDSLKAGIIGAFIGAWLLPQLGIRIGAGIVSAIVSATIGAVMLLLLLRVVRRGGRW
jgi:hypothetical protein